MIRKLIKGFLLFFAALAALALLASISISRSKTDIISWFVIDLDNDSNNELLAITKDDVDADMTLDTGDSYGSHVKIYSDFTIVNHAPVLKEAPDYIFDLSEIKPLKVQAGDIDGDGEPELAVCVYKTTKFHPILAKRPFFYRLKDGKLESVWLGSRLARPFMDYILFDADGDGIDEIVSIERLENENKIVAIYDWKGFGFEVKTISEELEGTITFINNRNGKEEELHINIAGENYQLFLIGSEIEFSRY